MADVLSRDAEVLRRALAQGGDEVQLRLSRETAEWVARIVAARARGQQVVLTHGRAEVTPAEAAALLGMSRPQVRKLMDDGRLPFRKVGSHHRISLSAIQALLDAERARMDADMKRFARLQNELGLFE